MIGPSTVAVVGGGPAGAIAALVLVRRGLRTVVLEERSTPARKVGECLPPSLSPLLRHLGLEDLLRQDGHLRSLGNRAVWGSARPGDSPFLAGTRGDGWHVDRRRFEARLAESAEAAGADWRWGARLVGCERRAEGGWRLTIEVGGGRERLDADFVADATGRPARVARRLGSRRVHYDRLVGVAALLVSPTPAADTYTLVEAMPEGWWYSALLADGRLALAFMTDGDLFDRQLLAAQPGSRLELTAPWDRLLGASEETRSRIADHDYRLAEPPRALPAETSRLDSIAGDGWFAVGDAAASYDPLSSHGIGSAMGSGFYAGNAIADLLAGRPEAQTAYLDFMQQAYGTYLDLQRHHYAEERRWPAAPFWARRHAESYCLEPV